MSRLPYVLALASVALPSLAQRAPLFKDEVLPVLEKSCTKCHRPDQKMGGLDLSTFSGLMAGGASGPAIAPGKPNRSLLWIMIESGKMRLGGAFPSPKSNSSGLTSNKAASPAPNSMPLNS